jgi:hypothetical protein
MDPHGYQSTTPDGARFSSSERRISIQAGAPLAGPHLMKDDRHATAGELPGALRAGQAGADDMDGGAHRVLLITNGTG